MKVNRRAVLKLGAAGVLAPAVTESQPLACPPRPPDLASDRLVHRLHNLFNPPAIQNEWGYAQAAKSVAGRTGISIPPCACCGLPRVPAAAWSELHTPAWMHALLPADATWKLRVDHSRLGAFGAWSAMTARGYGDGFSPDTPASHRW
jgi:hypothetical protein